MTSVDFTEFLTELGKHEKGLQFSRLRMLARRCGLPMMRAQTLGEYLKTLRDAGLVESESFGGVVYYRKV